jgi:hypothetical protein
MSARAHTATAMAFRDQRRRPLVLILLAIFPAYLVLKRAVGVAADGGRIQRGSPGRRGIDA